MTLFVLIYDRRGDGVVELKLFDNTERDAADEFRMRAERTALLEDLDQDIVLFQAESREALERTHGGYFLNDRQLLESTLESLSRNQVEVEPSPAEN